MNFYLPICQVLHKLAQTVLEFQLQYGWGTKYETNFYSFQSFQVKITFQLVWEECKVVQLHSLRYEFAQALRELLFYGLR